MTIERYFMGLADRTRLRILNLLLSGELCGCDIEYVLDVSQSNVSRHLNYLRQAGLVRNRRDGYRVYYRLADGRDQSMSLLFDYLRRAFARDQTFGADSRALAAAVRKGPCTISEAPSRRTTAGARSSRSRSASA
jgi:ArsR family transcriptional regulator